MKHSTYSVEYRLVDSEDWCVARTSDGRILFDNHDDALEAFHQVKEKYEFFEYRLYRHDVTTETTLIESGKLGRVIELREPVVKYRVERRYGDNYSPVFESNFLSECQEMLKIWEQTSIAGAQFRIVKKITHSVVV
jgi:hypothetical protein